VRCVLSDKRPDKLPLALSLKAGKGDDLAAPKKNRAWRSVRRQSKIVNRKDDFTIPSLRLGRK
jgi:hypothetical protein